ncbi:hypothetical protein F5887DRAFT_955412 [Amanita rubescens]|nr:hypothetical protein F5887DRAFT_955412 [Amanita rubescens]
MITQTQTSKAMKLSPEIVSEIFKNFSTTVIIHKPQLFPWFLGQICAEWRSVFLSSSTQFWGYIEIDHVKKAFPGSVHYFKRALDILNFCLKCSQGCPLSFMFRMSLYPYYADEYAYVVDILNALITQSMRWLKAEIYFLPVTELQRLHCVKGRVPLLQSFFLSLPGDLWGRRDLGPLQVDERFAGTFEQSPNLKHLRLSDMRLSKFHWTSIESFRLRSLTDAGKLFAALSQATSLEELEIAWITLPSLKKLVLQTHNILGALTAPGLEHLSVNFRGRKEQITTIPSFVHRSSCSLKHLSLWSSEPAATVELLSHIPGLSSLLSIKFLDCDMPEGASLVAPRLKSLEMETRTELNTAMVASRARNPGVDGLQKLSLRTDSTRSTGDLTTLQEQCEKNNVKLTVGRLSA